MMLSPEVSRLVRRLEQGERAVEDEILKVYFQGAEVAGLLALLGSSNIEVAKAAAWVASELGERASPIVSKIAPFLRHGGRYVRYFLLDVALECAQRRDSEVLVASVDLIRSTDTALRRKAATFLARASIDQLEGVVESSADMELAVLSRWLVDTSQQTARHDEIEERLNSEDQLTRLFAVAAAARNQRIRPDLILAAQSSEDPEIRLLASEHLRSG